MMNSYERFQARLRGAAVDRVPNFDIMMARAAHHIGESLSHYYQDYHVLVNANLAMLDDFSLDIVQAISDPYREAADLGLEVEFPLDNLPVSKTPLLAFPEDLKRLKPVDPTRGPRMLDRLEAIHAFRDQVGGRVPIMGWVEGALAEAADLRGVGALLSDLYDRPEWVIDLLEICTEQAIAFARAQVQAGADIIGLGDAICSQVSPKMYRQFAQPYEQRIFSAVREMGAAPRLHICGNTTKLLPAMAASGAQIIDLDWMVDLKQAVDVFGNQVAPCGNFDPVNIMLQGTEETVRAAVTETLRMGGSRLFSAAGCEIPDNTPTQNLLAQTETLSLR
jgi:MtaA/CmuA family methyltransferase